MQFPDRQSAPSSLRAIDGSCGLLVAWGVLTHFGRRSSPKRLIDACRYTKKHGVFTIALGLALHERGLRVTFHSDPDPAPNRIERTCYARARIVGLPVKRGISVSKLLSMTNRTRIAVALYNTAEGNGHFSPVLGQRLDRLLMPYSDEGWLDRRTFARRWREPDVLGQCLFVEDTR
jgi:hypothetical protein